MKIKAAYRCKLCGKRFYRETALNSNRDLSDALRHIMEHDSIDWDIIPDSIIHKCDTDYAGIAKLIGLRRFEN